MRPPRVPVSTYRVQFNKDFRFVDARDIVPYLHRLGIGDLYASPRFRARRGSSHGYDVADPWRVNSELGSDEEFDDLCGKLRHYDMGLLLDIVPNHMAASDENPWWMDVLENGRSSPYAHYFDIDWHPTTLKATFLQENKVLLPVLGDLYGKVLENEEFTLYLDEHGLFVRYQQSRFPLDPKSYGPILEHCAGRLAWILGEEHSAVREMRQLQDAVAKIPARTATAPEEIEQRLQQAAACKQKLFYLYRDQLDVRLAMDAALRELCGVKGDARSFDPLHSILEAQAYRLSSWKIGFEEINYRRFFDVNDLVGLRVQDTDVFEARHHNIVQLVADEHVDGLRVDHIDGLHDPLGYLERLQNAVAPSAGPRNPHSETSSASRQDRKSGASSTDPQNPSSATPSASRQSLDSASPFAGPQNPQSEIPSAGRQDLYVVVEKVLGRGEPLPQDWQTCGTTGYDFLNALNDLFIEPKGLQALEAAYARFTDEETPFAEICYARNKQVMWQLFAGEVNALGHHLGKLAAMDRQARDVPLSELMRALVEVTACLPVYRSYIRDFEIAARDRFYLERTLGLARRRTTEEQVSTPAFAFLRRVLLLQPPPYCEDQKQEWLRFVMRWQQFTGPVMAKGLEDTAFYVHNSLISRNEVGGDPLRETPPLDLDHFHQFNQERLEHWPFSLNATSTHDTKRGEDARARINVLSELAAEWETRLRRWSRMNKDKKTIVEGKPVPAPGEEVLLYQSLLGAWPLEAGEADGFPERFKGFVIKSAREAKTYTGWIRPNEAHEGALLRFVDAILEDSEANLFRKDFLRFQKKIAFYGALNGLSQVLIKITAPGVPDFYQGSELWNLSLVDPDNRRPVDFGKCGVMLEELRKRETLHLRQLLKETITHWEDGRVKLYLSDKALDFRREHAEVFRDGDYIPVFAAGPKRANICACIRKKGTFCALSVAPRWTTQLTPAGRPPLGKKAWRDTALLLPGDAPDKWQSCLTGEKLTASLSPDGQKILPLHRVLGLLPVALLGNL